MDAQHRRETHEIRTQIFSFIHFKIQTFEDLSDKILDREDEWFEQQVKEAIYVKVEKASLNRGGGLRHQLSPTYSSISSAIPKTMKRLTPT